VVPAYATFAFLPRNTISNAPNESNRERNIFLSSVVLDEEAFLLFFLELKGALQKDGCQLVSPVRVNMTI